ncbi:MAG: UPF0251 protein DIV41_01465 [Oscillospiraceae bacterium]|jgi:uncharacterized protein
MPRPRKWRRVCCMPSVSEFRPDGEIKTMQPLLMTVEEYEIIRLIDWEGLSQEEAAGEMDVARSTVQRIYEEARRKLADCLVNGKMLKISGGNYRLCSGGEQCGRCRHRCPLHPNYPSEKNS